jgi:hypothetical protein
LRMCVCVSLSLCVLETLSLSLSLCVFAVCCSLSVSLFRANMCTADDVQCSSTTATPKMPDCNAMRISGPQTQLLNTSFQQDLFLSLSLSLFRPCFQGILFRDLVLGHLFTDLIISVPRFRTPSLPDLVFRNSFTDLASGPPFQDHYSFPDLVFSQPSIFWTSF